MDWDCEIARRTRRGKSLTGYATVTELIPSEPVAIDDREQGVASRADESISEVALNEQNQDLDFEIYVLIELYRNSRVTWEANA